MLTPEREPLNEYIKVQQKADIELRRILRESAAMASRIILRQGNGVGGTVRVAQLGIMLDQINGLMEETWGDVERATNKYFGLAEGAADRAAMSIYRVLAAHMTERQAESLLDAFMPYLERGLELDNLRRPLELSQRVYKNIQLSTGLVEKTIRAGIINQVSARELATEVRRFIRPDAPGGISYSAMRLARTEINNAFHERQIAQGTDNPFVAGTKWNLSRRHPKPDACDERARGGVNGDGVYEARAVPSKPHPQCLCYMTYETVDEATALSIIRLAA